MLGNGSRMVGEYGSDSKEITVDSRVVWEMEFREFEQPTRYIWKIY